MTIAGLSLGAYVFLLCAVALGALVQRIAGQAFGLIATPMVAMVAPQFLPSTMLLLGLFVGVGALSVDLSAINWREAAPGGLGRFLGAVGGVAVAAALSAPEAVAITVAIIVLAAIALSLSGVAVRINAVSLIVAGIIAGIMATITAIGAPPMALLYANEEARRARAMQNLFFLWGMMTTLPMLAWFGMISAAHVTLAVALAPGAALGLLAARPAARMMEGRPIRPWALGFSGLAAVSLLLRYGL